MSDVYDGNGQLIQPPASELTADDLHASLFVPATVSQPALDTPDQPVQTMSMAEPVLIPVIAPVEPSPAIQAEPAMMDGFVSEAVFDKLKTILTALGHELPVFFDEAVALAKKAL